MQRFSREFSLIQSCITALDPKSVNFHDIVTKLACLEECLKDRDDLKCISELWCKNCAKQGICLKCGYQSTISNESLCSICWGSKDTIETGKKRPSMFTTPIKREKSEVSPEILWLINNGGGAQMEEERYEFIEKHATMTHRKDTSKGFEGFSITNPTTNDQMKC